MLGTAGPGAPHPARALPSAFCSGLAPALWAVALLDLCDHSCVSGPTATFDTLWLELALFWALRIKSVCAITFLVILFWHKLQTHADQNGSSHCLTYFLLFSKYLAPVCARCHATLSWISSTKSNGLAGLPPAHQPWASRSPF